MVDNGGKCTELAAPSTPSTLSTLHDNFYGIDVSEHDRLSFSLLLEKVCDGLGHWYLSIDPEFQKDVLAGSKLFWERQSKQADADVKGEAEKRTTDTNDQTAATVKIQCAAQSWTDSGTDRKTDNPTPTTQKRPGRTRRKKDSEPLNFRYYREQAGLSQKALGELIGYKQNQVFLLENGLLKMAPNVSLENQKILEDALGAPFDELIQPIRTA